MTKKRETRSDSNEFLLIAARDAILGIKPPLHCTLRNCDLPYWKDITDARFGWTEVDLVHAVTLARTLADIAENQRLLDSEGYIKKTKNGPVKNPRHAVIKDLVDRSVKLSQKLQVHAIATIGDVEFNRNKNAAKQAAVKELGADQTEEQSAAPKAKTDDDLLLPRPTATH